MITYKDRAWCSQKCGNESCYRNYTPEEQEKNVNDLPLCIADMKTDDCGYVEREQ